MDEKKAKFKALVEKAKELLSNKDVAMTVGFILLMIVVCVCQFVIK